MNQSRFVQWKTENPTAYAELLRRRRKRYRNDAEARKKQLAYNAAWREKQKKRKTKGSRTPQPKVIEIDGRRVECWSIGRTAKFLGVSKQTITNLEAMDTIPTNHYVCPKRGHRWWPASFVRWLKPFFDVRFPQEGPGISAREFHRRVWTGWAEEQVRGEIPVIAASEVSEDGDAQGSTEGVAGSQDT